MTKELKLVLTYKYYDMIDSGEKPEEYRNLTTFYRRRLETGWSEPHLRWRKYDIVTFYRGYAKGRKTMSFKYGGCRVGTGQEKWGAEPGKEYYVIKLGERIWHKYIDAEKLKELINEKWKGVAEKYGYGDGEGEGDAEIRTYLSVLRLIDSLQHEQPAKMIQWTGNNLKEVIDFTGRSSRFGEMFNSWEEYENYVHTHYDILKLFCEDGSHYEVPVGAWIVKTPDGYNVPSVAKYIQQVQLNVDLEGEVEKYFGDYWKNSPLLVQRELINFARTFVAKGYIWAKGL